MDYDPENYITEWRDVCSGFCLAGAALLALTIATSPIAGHFFAPPPSQPKLVADQTHSCDIRQMNESES